MCRLAFARRAALGGAMVLAGLLMAAVAARADDLTDQHHPNAALQQKLDLLDHGSDTPDTPPPGAAVTPGSFPRSVLIPGTNTSIHVFGSVSGTAGYSR